MTFIEPPAIAKPVISSIVVPRYLFEAAERTGVSLMGMTVFSELRKFASLEDIAILVALNSALAIDAQSIATRPMSAAMTLGSGHPAEMDMVVNRMATSKEIIERAIDTIAAPSPAMMELITKQLQGVSTRDLHDNTMTSTANRAEANSGYLPYQLKTSGSNVFVVVDGGFNKYVGPSVGKEEPLIFVRDFLKLCTDMFSAPEVARHPLFKTFLYTLAG